MGVGTEEEDLAQQRVSLGGADDSMEFFNGGDGDDGRVSFGQDDGPLLGQDDGMFSHPEKLHASSFEDALLQPDEDPSVSIVEVIRYILCHSWLV